MLRVCRPSLVLFFFSFPFLAGCSSGDFASASPADDSSTEAGGDSSIAPADTPIDTTSDIGPTPDSQKDAAPDVIGTEVSEAATDSGVGEVIGSETTEACVANVCGGCKPLTGKPGDPCGDCGKLVCGSDADSLHCSDPGKNVCGGCAPIIGKPTDSCCGGGTLSCSADKNSLVCSTSDNGCGGCTVLDHAKGTPCGGVCGTATYQCSGKESTTCSDPVPTLHVKGSTCGSCGSWQCNVTGTDLLCTGDHPFNACGGCATISATPGAACGTCGVWTCSADKNSVSCVETPMPTTACTGQCGTASYKCTTVGVWTCVDPLAPPAYPKVGDPCNACGNYACNPSKTNITCVGIPSSSSRCTARPYDCDWPTCNPDGTCTYPPNDAICTPAASAGNPPGCSVDKCTDGATCPPPGDPEPQIKCGTAGGTPPGGCTQKLASDADHDGYSTVAGCFLSKHPNPDCNDGDANVFPTQSTYFSTPMGGTYDPSKAIPNPGVTLSYDYNCNGVEEQRDTQVATCKGTGAACTINKAGYVSSVPNCGVSGDYTATCTWIVTSGGGACLPDSSLGWPQTQTCR